MSVNERINFVLAITGTIPPRNDDERELAAMFAVEMAASPRWVYQRSDTARQKYRDYMRQYQRDHPPTLAQQARDNERANDRRAIERFIRDIDKWQKLLKTI